MDTAYLEPLDTLTGFWFRTSLSNKIYPEESSKRSAWQLCILDLFLGADMLWWTLSYRSLCLAALLVVASCIGSEQKRGADEGSRSSSGRASSTGGSSSRRYHRLQHGQCTYTFILPEGDGNAGASCRETKAGTQYNANSLQRDAPPPEPDYSNQKIQQLEHIMENYTQWLQKVKLSQHLISDSTACWVDSLFGLDPDKLAIQCIFFCTHRNK